MTKEEFKKLFDSHFDAVRNYVYYRSGDIELSTDIAQDVFFKLWEKQLQPEDTVKVKSLLYKIASDIFITRYRRGVVEQNYSKNITLDIERNTPEEQLQYEETLKKYNTTLTKLTDKQRTIFLMSRNEDLKYKEIAERLNISIKSVEKHITKALSHFKKVFNK